MSMFDAPKVGEVECDYGQFSHTCHVDGTYSTRKWLKTFSCCFECEMNGLILVAPISSVIN